MLEDSACTTGINTAKDQGACESLFSDSPCETRTAKVSYAAETRQICGRNAVQVTTE